MLMKSKLRLSVFRSNKYIYAQIIDDQKAHTVASLSDRSIKLIGTKTEKAREVGKKLAEKVKKLRIKASFFFDRGRSAYKGRIKALAEGAREGGLKF